MKGSITWLPATEENVKQIPKVDGNIYKSIDVLVKHTNGKVEALGIQWTHGDVMVHYSLSDKCCVPLDITHFAYINEPE